jgi:cystathionine beta-lyase/cystathionine gamma-synthase
LEKKMKIESKAVHTGERKRSGNYIPVTTPIHTAASYIYEDMSTLDRVFGREMEGPSYVRYNNPTTDALQEALTALESGAGALACGSGMMALHMAIHAALVDRRRSIVAAKALYGATIHLLVKILEPSGISVRFADFNNLAEVESAVAEEKPGCLLAETISNPLLRVVEVDKIAAIAKQAGAALIVDNTFATPMICRPLELGANMSVHSLTKYLSGHGDVLGGAIVSDAEHLETLYATARAIGPNLGPFESFLALRGIKTFPLRMERHCQNACRVASWLAAHPNVERVYFPGDPQHPDAAIARRLFPGGVYGAVVSFELKGVSGKEGVFRFMNALKMIVPATSVGDVHTMMLYPVISSHRDLSPKHRERLGIKDNLVRLSVGIEAVTDITDDLDQALKE